MAEALFQFDTPLQVRDGPSYLPRACGREAENELWEGWIEFLPDDGSAVLRSRRETLQPNREALLYWATGLTPVYLEGALSRTLTPRRQATVPPPAEPAYSGPASEPQRSSVPVAPSTVLDPIAVYLKEGEDLLRQELLALDPWHLRNILQAHGLDEGAAGDLHRLSRAELAERIVRGVKSHLEQPARR